MRLCTYKQVSKHVSNVSRLSHLQQSRIGLLSDMSGKQLAYELPHLENDIVVLEPFDVSVLVLSEVPPRKYRTDSILLD